MGSGSRKGSISGQYVSNTGIRNKVGLMVDSQSQGSGNSKLKGNMRKRQAAGKNDGDFEELFGKELDQFLEDSEWDMKDIEQASQGSAHVKNLERQFLKQQANM